MNNFPQSAEKKYKIWHDRATCCATIFVDDFSIFVYDFIYLFSMFIFSNGDGLKIMLTLKY